MDMARLASAFDSAMEDIYRKAKSEAGYTAHAFHQMLVQRRGVATARALINSPKVSAGYTALSELGRLDLTVEALVVDNPRWHPLFSPQEIDRARDRLRQYRYVPAADRQD